MRLFRASLTTLIATFTLLTHGQCPIGNVTISSQADANAFAANYGTCDTLPGDLIIGPGDINDYFAFSGVRMIQGDLRMQAIYPVPLDMMGFSQLAHIGGDLFINSTLTETFTGLSALERIDGDLHVQFSSMLNFTGFSALSVIGGDLYVSNALDMTSMNGLTALDTIHGSLYMEGIESPSFTQIVIPQQLKYVGGNILVGSQYATGMGGGNALTYVGGAINIQGPSLQNVSGFNNLSIAGDLNFHFAPVLTSITGFASLDTILNSFHVEVPSLVSLTGFPELKVVAGPFGVGAGSGALQSITGFGLLSNIGWLTLASNPVLSNINAFDHAIEMEHLTITDNPQLSYCHVQAVCEFLLDSVFAPDIMNNATGCMSPTEVWSFCDLSTGIQLNEPLPIPLIYPNPVREVLRISLEEPILAVKIYDPTYRQVLSIAGNTVDVSTLPSGHYLVEVDTGAQLHRRSFIKE